jgi:vacuolar-type H+-ATPase catalytic subunit A/Vma1
MKTATVKELKNELSYRSQTELVELCLRLSKFKKENKELLTYLLFESSDEEAFIRGVKEEIESEFEQINTKSYFYIKKSVRKILRNTKKYIRYSKKKETEVELLLFFCETLKEMQPSYKNNVSLVNIFNRQVESIKRSIASLHEDLQFDYGMELDMLLEQE